MTEIAQKAGLDAGGPSSSSSPYPSQTPSTSKGERTTPIETPTSSQDQPLQKPRVRKRSFFGKASKPSTPSEPVPSFPQNVNNSESTRRNEDVPLVSPMGRQDDYLSVPTQTPSERSPVRSFILRRQGHGRSPSTSALPSPPPTGFTSYDDQTSSPSPKESLKSHDLPKQEFREGVSQSLGRKAGTMSVANQNSNWYNRGPMAKAHVLSNAITRGRDRSASVNASPRPAKKHDKLMINAEKDSNLYRVPESPGFSTPSSPLNLRRSFSRRSIYSLRGDQSSSEISEASQGQRDAPLGAASSTPNAKPRRKLFGRPSSRAIDVSSSSNSNSIPTGSHHDDRSSSDHSSGHPFKKLHHVSSNSMLQPKNGSAGLDPMASTDSLASNSTSSVSRGITRRAGEMIQKSASLANWGRKSRSTLNVAEEIEEQPTSTPAVSESEARSPSISEFGATNTNSLSSPSAALHSSATEAGIPKRLSGWIYNMLGNDAEQTNATNEVGIQVSDSTATLRQVPEAHQRNHESTLRGSQDGSAKNSGELSKSVNKDNDPPTITSRSRTAGLLSALAVSGRNRTEGNTPNAASNPSSSNAIGSGVGVARSGLDRALRYFIDNSEQDSDAEVGAWLLGVWHGPSGDNSPVISADMTSKLRPAIEVSDATPEREQTGRASTNAEATTSSSKIDSEQGHEDDSSIASSAHRTRETSPSIASASSRGSVSKRKSSNKVESDEVIVGDEAQIVARNPPTPQTSPIIPQSQITSSPSSSRRNRRPMQAAESASSLTTALRSNADNQVSFQSDFSSRIWCTYRSHFTPIARDGTISSQAENAAALAAAQHTSSTGQMQEGARATPQKYLGEGPHSSSTSISTPSRNAQHSSTPQHSLGNAFGISPPPSSSPSNPSQGGGSGIGLGERMGIPNLWNRATAAAQAYGLAGRSGLTTDAGWGCMLRTGQSVLANALLNVHLGRSWRRNGKPIPASQIDDGRNTNESKEWQMQRQQYAKYVQLLSWFMDEPSSACPFGVHRMAREGKRLGKEVGEWFGPSTAAGAIKKLVDEFPACGLGVSVASDGVIYLDQVKVQACKSNVNGQKRASALQKWERPILVLIGVRLGLEGVHPMYHDSIKAAFSFPQSVGIAGGRPSSSYYFVGYQGNSLFYLDPHHVRSSVAFKHPPPSMENDDEWWAHAYSEQELATFHNDRPRRMPMKSLDPSMLLGFLIQDEEDLHDFVVRVKALPRPIFSVLDSMPKWMMDDLDDDLDAEEKAIESISESSADDFELESEKSNATPEKSNVERSAQSIVTVGNSSSPERSSEERRKENLKAPEDPKGKARSGRSRQQRKVTPSTSNTEEPLSLSTNSTQTPRSEATFEFISPHNEAPNGSEPPPVPSKGSTPVPIAFPTFASRDEDDDASPNETFDVGSYDDSKAVHSVSSEEPEHISSEHTAKTISGNEVQVIEDADDEDSREDLADVGENDIDAAWEDLQDDIRCSPRVDIGRWSHADAIIRRAEAEEHTQSHNLDSGDEENLHS
ncbi:uncharacterized protein FA14DRAFT_161247 [Meira miltonrushii]|uniref:Autophagy-related protein 4 n=1 Tax=Meira miltonrushii TaxID=1280837 RepID=A0A316VAX3_9BASI|nr:uncharacterized protein FA14DRAFT_161247 [Meira miltonrushii]PWN33353.1 hypothetical protein FA14DRAFT_161247 [Meira miltonrushii]